MGQIVLLIEPDGGLRDMFRNILEEENFVVDAVQSMQQGQQHAQHYTYHYALVDMLLASQDDIAGILSIHRSQPDMEIILLTDQPRAKKYFFDHGFAEYGIKAILPSLFRLDDLFMHMTPKVDVKIDLPCPAQPLRSSSFRELAPITVPTYESKNKNSYHAVTQ